ncbi:MAG: phosphotransferase enzyme family protein [Methylococcales bacterium]
MDTRTEQVIAARFLREGRVASVRGLGKGLINDTYLVSTDSPAVPRFVLQRINGEVFPFPDRIMANLERLSSHLAARIDDLKESAKSEAFRMPALLLTTDGKNCHIGEAGEYWRALTYIENSRTLDRLESQEDAGQVGFALGRFHREVRDLDPVLMQDSLPGFHITPVYLSHYDRIAASARRRKLPGSFVDLRFCEDFVDARRNRAPVLETARQDGRLMPRVIHGDPKLNNILFETRTRTALTLIDLDTVQSGLILYDIGDCLRSCCNRAGESAEGLETATFDLDICEAILTQYFQECAPFMSKADIDHLVDAVHLLPFELGLRFLSDHLDGNRYFKVGFPEHNLARALIQFGLVQSIEKQERTIRLLIRKISSRPVER